MVEFIVFIVLPVFCCVAIITISSFVLSILSQLTFDATWSLIKLPFKLIKKIIETLKKKGDE